MKLMWYVFGIYNLKNKKQKYSHEQKNRLLQFFNMCSFLFYYLLYITQYQVVSNYIPTC